jgi:hypothetical protein
MNNVLVNLSASDGSSTVEAGMKPLQLLHPKHLP